MRLLIGLALLLVVAGCAPADNYNDEYIQLLRDYEVLSGDYAKLQSEAIDDLWLVEALKRDLGECQNRPAPAPAQLQPRLFANIAELDTWIDAQPVPSRESSDAVQWFDRALRLQRQALEDGYLINVELDSEDDEVYSVYCTATLADGSYYWWEPDALEAFYWLDYVHF
jgi:hypothetical protein